ncbi:MAG: hypothetical protein M1835_001331 [Candelina submexicana]|nr:MAG: hypothetical protein M1835_001331 [Candelina submexicana]
MLGQVKTDQTTKKRVLKVVTPTPSSLRKTRQALIEHADYVKFAFSTKKHDHFAETLGGPCNVDEDPTTLIRLHRGFLDSIVDEYPSFSLCHQLRFQFFFALNLVHELAHSVYWLLSDCEEPHFAIDEPLAELGASWEYSVFGGKIQPINLKTVSADSGLMAYEWQTEEASDAAGGKIFCALPMEYISSFFSRKRWGLVEIFGIGQLNAPMEAACKSYYPLTTDHPDLYEDDE